MIYLAIQLIYEMIVNERYTIPYITNNHTVMAYPKNMC
jgi:hypothetical protein